MHDRVFGLEMEYCFAAVRRGGSTDRPTDELIALAREIMPYLHGGDAWSIFLPNGSRLYKDSGEHPEIACSEVSNPWDAVRYAKAADRVIAELAAKLQVIESMTEVIVSRCNVDYRSLTTWGCHESYMHSADPKELPVNLVPFLVSRVVFTGAGGLNPFVPGIEFAVSPRSFFTVETLSEDSTSRRPIYHTKNESLTRSKFNRLHVLGESTCSETSSWLKMGTTAIVVALAEAGKCPGSGITLQSPVRALHAFAADPSCTRVAMTSVGEKLTALDIQHRYLAAAEQHMHDDFMPVWTEKVCRRWRAVLEALAAGSPTTVTGVLDWAMKLELYTRRAEQRGFTGQSLKNWTYVMKRLTSALDESECTRKRVTAEFVLSKTAPAPVVRRVKELGDTFMRNNGMTWKKFRPFLALRDELCELDVRFSEVGTNSIFHALDEAGALSHHVPGIDNIDHAMAHGPPDTRAHLRGECVRRFAEEDKDRYYCDWDGVWDSAQNRCLDLSDPFVTQENWVEIKNDDESDARSMFQDPLYREIVRRRRERRLRRTQDVSETDRESLLSTLF